MKEFFIDLFDYSNQYNTELIEIFEKQTTSEKSQLLFSHILNAQHIWNSRIIAKEPKYDVWKNQEISSFKEIQLNNFNTSIQIINQYDLNYLIKYSNSKGQRFENSVKEILFQIVNHTTYHRAQIATEFKNIGIKPLLTDYIFYKR